MSHSEGPIEQKKEALDPKILEQAQAIVREPFISYRATHDRLEQSQLLAPVVEHVEKLYAQELSEATFLTPHDWEMLATLWLYDEETAIHSVDTYRIARNRIREPLRLKDPPIQIDLLRAFSHEGVTEEQFLRACLLHDIGKLAVPVEVITNHVTDIECADILLNNYDTLEGVVRAALRYPPEQPLPTSVDTLLVTLRMAHIRPQGLVPIRLMLSSDAERDSVARGLEHLGLSLDDSLLTITRTHDGYSRSILSEEGLPFEAELAGAHHRHEKGYSPTNHSLAIGIEKVSIDLADIIHLADVTQAMKSRRHYKTPIESELIVLSTLVTDANANNDIVDPFATYLWVADRLNRITSPIDSVDGMYYQTIQTFLDKKREMYHEILKAYGLINGVSV